MKKIICNKCYKSYINVAKNLNEFKCLCGNIIRDLNNECYGRKFKKVSKNLSNKVVNYDYWNSSKFEEFC